MGLQDGKGVEMSLGTEGAPDVSTATAATPTAEEVAKLEATADEDGDIVLGDSKPKEGEVVKDEIAIVPQVESAESETTGETSQAPDAEKA